MSREIDYISALEQEAENLRDHNQTLARSNRHLLDERGELLGAAWELVRYWQYEAPGHFAEEVHPLLYKLAEAVEKTGA